MPEAINENTETFQPGPRRFKDRVIDGRHVDIGAETFS